MIILGLTSIVDLVSYQYDHSAIHKHVAPSRYSVGFLASRVVSRGGAFQ